MCKKLYKNTAKSVQSESICVDFVYKKSPGGKTLPHLPINHLNFA